MFQDEKVRAESTKIAMIQEKKMLLQELDFAREQLENLQRHHEEFEVKSKADVKLLVKEVKSLRSSQLDLKQELSQLMKEKLEVEVTYFFFKKKIKIKMYVHRFIIWFLVLPCVLK
jgi:predicted  nucleic acid-binding Zn-ribbon protein